jgi:hypothetical protein
VRTGGSTGPSPRPASPSWDKVDVEGSVAGAEEGHPVKVQPRGRPEDVFLSSWNTAPLAQRAAPRANVN